MRQIPIVAPSCDLRPRNLFAILAAGGERDDEITVVGYVWCNRAKSQVKRGLLKSGIRDSAGEVVAYQETDKRAALREARRRADPAETWQKTPSEAVHTMQLKRGKHGRAVLAMHLPAAVPIENGAYAQ